MSDNEPLTPGKVSRAWNSRPVFIGAAIVIAIAVLVVAAATITALTSPKGGGATGTKPAASSTSRPDTAGGCSVPAGSMSTTPAVPKDLAWKTGADGISWPTSKLFGPTKTESGFDACFAHSPLGAAFAAVTATYSQYDPKHTVQQALGFYIADSEGKAANIAGTAKSFNPAQLRSSGINPAGFIVDAYTANQAQVTLVDSVTSSATGYVGIPCTMVWHDGDWKLSVLDDGELSSGNPTTPSASDFVAWGGDNQ